MKKSNLIETLMVLSPIEIEKFTRFMRFFSEDSPGIDSKEAFTLLTHILTYYPKFSSIELSKENCFYILFPNRNYVDGKIDKIMVTINKELKKFLLAENYFREENDFNQILDLAKIYRQRGLNTIYEKTINFIKNNKDFKKIQSFESVLENYLLENEKHTWLSLYNKQNNDLNLHNTIISLFEYYQITMIELINKYVLQKNVKDLHINETIEGLIANILSAKQFEDSKFKELFSIQKEINSVISSPVAMASNLLRISDFLKKNSNILDPNMLKLFLTYLRNICIILKEKGVPSLDETLFYLQKDHLEKGYLFHDNKITSNAYMSVASTALLIGKHNWAFEFIESYKHRIIGDTPDQIYYKLNLSRYFFELKQYEKAIDYLTLNFTETTYVVIARRLELKAYYEIHSDLIPFKLDAYKMFINRISHKSYPNNKKELQINFINLFSQIVQSIPGDKARSHKIIKRILSKKVVADRDWLLEKAREIGNLSDDEYAEAIKNPPAKE